MNHKKKRRKSHVAQRNTLDEPALSGRHAYAIRQAKRVAQSSDCRFRMGAVILKGGTIIAAAPNKLRHDPSLSIAPISLHTEIATLRSTKIPYYRFSNLVMYVVRVSPFGELTTSKPCQACIAELAKYSFKKIYYIGECGSLEALANN